MNLFHSASLNLILTATFLFSTNVLAEANTPSRLVKLAIVNDNILRSGRPLGNDLAQLQIDTGITTVINLESSADYINQEAKVTKSLGLTYYSVPFISYLPPKDADVNKVLSLLRDSTHFPVLVHCQHGQDRTGMIVGLYRVEVEGWTPAKAYQEMLAMGFTKELIPLDNYFKKRTGYNGH